MNLLEAIKICYEGKDKPLDVKHYSNFAVWDQDSDTNWIKYRDARNFIYYQNKRLYETLQKLNLI